MLAQLQLVKMKIESKSEPKFKEFLNELHKKGVKIKVIDTPQKILKELLSKGIKIRYVTEQLPIRIYIVDRCKFICFEILSNKGEKVIAYTKFPSEKDMKAAKEYFNTLWESGKPIENLQDLEDL
jgi:hypothetical protein